MKAFLLIIVFIASGVVFAQDIRTVPQSNLLSLTQRLNSAGLISTRDYFFKLKPSVFIANDFRRYPETPGELNPSEIALFRHSETQYSYDLTGDLNRYSVTVGSPYSLLNDSIYNVFYSESENDYSFFMNGIMESDVSTDLHNGTNSSYLKAGMILGGRINDFYYYFSATNGSASGDKNNYLRISSFRQNFKFNEKPESSFFDETHGFISYQTKHLSIKLGRDYVLLGHSSNFPLLDNSNLPIDQFSIQIQTNHFNYSHLHAKVLDKIVTVNDTVAGPINSSVDKHIAYHRFSITLFSDLVLGLGEFVIYSDRGLDLSYINPFSFYKSIEHANRDRDNSILFLDVFYNTGKRIQPYGLLLIDDIDFAKAGTGWWGNQVLYNAGFWVFSNLDWIPFDVNVDWLKVEPYVFSHRIQRNNFANNGIGLASTILPNSENYAVSGKFYLNTRLNLLFSYIYTEHGSNYTDSNGNVKYNAGGDINTGKRITDSDIIIFGSGERERINKIKLELTWDFILNFRTTFGIDYNHIKSEHYFREHFYNYIKLSLKF